MEIDSIRFAFIFLLLGQLHMCWSQSENPRTEEPNELSIYLMGPNAVGSITYDRFVTPSFNLEGGIGYIGIHVGAKYHLFGNQESRKWTPYLGAAIARSLFPSVGTEYLPYFPVGAHFAGENRFTFSAELAPFQLSFLSWNVFGMKLGYRF